MKNTLKFFLFLPLLALSSLSFSAEDPVYTSFFSNKAVGGYDPVSYFTDNKPVKGKSQYTLEYKGADWLFVSQDHLEKFRANPEQYAPQYGGYCAWAVGAKNELYKGDPKLWTVHEGKLYLNYDQKIQDAWLTDRVGFIEKADRNWETILVQ